MAIPKSSWLSVVTAVPCEFSETSMRSWTFSFFQFGIAVSQLGLLCLSSKASGLQYPLDQPVLTHMIHCIQKKTGQFFPDPEFVNSKTEGLPMNCVLQRKSKTHVCFIWLQSCNWSSPSQCLQPKPHCPSPLLSPLPEQLHQACLAAPKRDCLLLQGGQERHFDSCLHNLGFLTCQIHDRPTKHPGPHLAHLLEGQSLCEHIQIAQ